ncbi:uncharacterized protein LOC134195565 isoform X2 [Corticium candelabrum]|uniref:uncharacterized protein LOC134195565 isoform X2 n=1 Tax=Corticium candelabrum TaxID=121492 RepID=UPI002E26B74F|nr:uncharacterized protein LOC134195565 isoform X2 [Corticium candelabrum]
MALQDSLVRLQAVVRGHSVRCKLNDAKTKFLDIVHEIEGETSHISWNGNGVLTTPTFSVNDNGRRLEPANQHKACTTLTNQLPENSETGGSRSRRSSGLSNDTNSLIEYSEKGKDESDRASVRSVMCGTDDRDFNVNTLTETLTLKHVDVEDVGCQTSLSDDDLVLESGETQRDSIVTKCAETELPDRCFDINRSFSGDSETVAENVASPVKAIAESSSPLQQTSAPVESRHPPVVHLPSADSQKPRNLHAWRRDTESERCRSDTKVEQLDDSSVFNVTSLSSTWPSIDSDDIDLTEDRATLVKQREELALELVWIRQAIESRKQYLTIKSQLDMEDAVRCGMQQPDGASSN